MVRPARAAFVTTPEALTVTVVTQAAQLATSAWGGKYFPIIECDGSDDDRRSLEGLGIDFVQELPGAGADALAIAEMPGFRWSGGRDWGPFAKPKSSISMRLLQATRLEPDPTGPAGKATLGWAEDDPLNHLFDVWFGRTQDSNGNVGDLSGFFDESDASIVESIVRGSAVESTARHISYSGYAGDIGFCVIRPGDARDLARFWNARAFGGRVFPWPVGHEDRVLPLARTWLRYTLEHLPSERIAQDREPFVQIWSASQSVPAELTELIRSQSARVLATDLVHGSGWTDLHPLRTRFRASFDAEVTGRMWSVTATLPALPLRITSRDVEYFGTVAADVHIYRETGLDPDRTAIIPRVRTISTAMPYRDTMSQAFQRPNGEGSVLSVLATDETVTIPLMRPDHILQTILNENGVTVEQSDEGRFASRFASMLGGPDSLTSTEPAAREILSTSAGRADHGISLNELEQRALNARGDWPDPLRSAVTPKQYVRNLTLAMTSHGLLRVCLPVTCPTCRSKFAIDPNGLNDHVRCQFCGEDFPLALTLAWQGRKADWKYRIAGHVAQSRLRSALPTLAAATVFNSIGAHQSPYFLGMKLMQRDRELAEVDLVVFSDPQVPEVVFCEVKSHTRIGRSDIEKLMRVQDRFGKQPVDCYIAVATLNEDLDDTEITLLREYAERAPATRRTHAVTAMALPIVLTAKELSVHPFSDLHPSKWSSPGVGMSSVALESCRQNLGLDAITPRAGGGSSFSWRSM